VRVIELDATRLPATISRHRVTSKMGSRCACVLRHILRVWLHPCWATRGRPPPTATTNRKPDTKRAHYGCFYGCSLVIEAHGGTRFRNSMSKESCGAILSGSGSAQTPPDGGRCEIKMTLRSSPPDPPYTTDTRVRQSRAFVWPSGPLLSVAVKGPEGWASDPSPPRLPLHPDSAKMAPRFGACSFELSLRHS